MPEQITAYPRYHPIADLYSLRAIGQEVLARGRCTQTGDEVGAASVIGDDVAARADYEKQILQQALECLSQQDPQRLMFINLRPDDLTQGQLVQHLRQLADKLGIAPSQIVLELVELPAQGSIRTLASAVQHCRDQGFALAVDDWGAGASNFDRLYRIQPDFLKIDTEFLWQAVEDDFAADSLHSAVTMAVRMGIQVIAEGVETTEHLHMAMATGCTLAQGYALSRPAEQPVPDEKFAQFLQTGAEQYRETSLRNLARGIRRLNSLTNELHAGLVQGVVRTSRSDDLLAYMLELMQREPDIHRSYLMEAATGKQRGPSLVRLGGRIRKDSRQAQRCWRPAYLQARANWQVSTQNHTVTGPVYDVFLERHLYCISMVAGNQFILAIEFDPDLPRETIRLLLN